MEGRVSERVETVELGGHTPFEITNVWRYINDTCSYKDRSKSNSPGRIYLYSYEDDEPTTLRPNPMATCKYTIYNAANRQ